MSAETLLASVRGPPVQARNTLLSGATMGGLIIDALDRYPDRVAFVDGDRSMTYRQLSDRIGQAIAMFRRLGMQRGDVVAQLSGNRSDVFALIAAVYIAGLRSTTLHAMASLEDHAYILQDSEAKLFVVDAAHLGRGLELRAELTQPIQWFCHDESGAFSSFWAEAGRLVPEPLVTVSDPEDIIRLAYTGGTTGKPKGVMLSNRSLVTNTVLALAGMEWPAEVRFLCPTPISHGAGSFILPTLIQGGAFILQGGFDAAEVLRATEQHRVTMLFLVPTMIYALLDHPASHQADFSSLHTLVYGAAPMAPARIREALERLGPVLCQSYGQTEAPNTILTLSRDDHLSPEERRLWSAGKPYPGLQVRLLDDDDQAVRRGEVGELCVRGPLVMSGYLRQPDLTEQALRGDWLHTGDMAMQDEQGFFYLVDRKKDLIISGGFNVYPGEVEKVLTEHPAVSAASVIGVPDPKWGEAVKAVVVLRPGAEASAADLVQFVRERKGPVNAPKSVDFVDAIPVTALGKPDKKALRARYWGHQARNIN